MQNLHKFIYLWAYTVLLSLGSGTYAQDTTTDCPATQRFDTALNRCVSTKSTLTNQTEYKECEGKSNTDERASCYQKKALEQEAKIRNAKNFTNLGEKDINKGKTAQTVTSGLFSALSLWMAVGKDSISSHCTSTKIFAVTSMAGFAKNIFFEKDIKKETNKMSDDFIKETKEKSSMKDAQVAAFDYLEKEQKFLQKYANDQEKLYKYLSYGYAGSVAMAAYEAFQKTPSSFMERCSAGKEEAAKAKAEGNSIGAKVDASAALISQYLDTPMGIIIAGGLAAVQSYSLAGHMGDKAAEAGENIETIAKLKEKYLASISTYCPDGRDNLAKPYCYCYTDAGKKNTNRTNSQTCQNLWKDPNSLYADTSDALRGSGLKNVVGCVYADGKFDAGCECKRLTNSKGENACLKVSVSQSSLSGIPGIAATTLSNSLNKSTGSVASTGEIEDADIAQAATANKGLNNLMKKLIPAIEKESKKKYSDLEKALLSAAEKSAGNSRVAIYNPSPAQLAALRPDSVNLEALTNDLSQTGSGIISKSGNYDNKKAAKKNIWNMDSSDSSSDVLSFSDVSNTDKKYNYGTSDINTDKEASIWNVISKRYNQSGLRRLFDE